MKDWDQWWEDRLESEVRDIAEKIGEKFFDLMQPWRFLSEETQAKIRDLF